jgi:hypothetical protein
MWTDATDADALRARVSYLEGEVAALASVHERLVSESESEIRRLDQELRESRRDAEAMVHVMHRSMVAGDDIENAYAFNAKRPRRADAIQDFDERWRVVMDELHRRVNA